MKHLNCKYFLATDVFKGICKRSKEKRNADDLACSEFEKAPKCKYCRYYSTTEDNLGFCMQRTRAYPEMKAIACEDFSWC